MRERIRGLIQHIEGLTALDGVGGTVVGWVGRATQPDAVKDTLSGTWLGHQLHPMLTDLPIGAWALASFLDLTAGRSGAGPARRLVGLGLVATLPTAAAGASDWADTYGPTQRVGLVHALANVTAAGFQATSWVQRRRGQHLAGAALSAVGLGVTVCAGYLGGHLSLVRGVGVNHTAFEPAVTEWTQVAARSSLTDRTPVRVTANGVPVVLVQLDGTVHALSATCLHAGGPLDEGTIVHGDCLRCPWHGSTFSLADGQVERGPAAVDQPSWEVKVDDGRVHVRSRSTA